MFESKPAAARTLPPLENPLRLALVQGYQRAGAASGTTVVPDERLDRAMDDLARSLDDGEDPRSETVEFLRFRVVHERERGRIADRGHDGGARRSSGLGGPGELEYMEHAAQRDIDGQ